MDEDEKLNYVDYWFVVRAAARLGVGQRVQALNRLGLDVAEVYGNGSNPHESLKSMAEAIVSAGKTDDFMAFAKEVKENESLT